MTQGFPVLSMGETFAVYNLNETTPGLKDLPYKREYIWLFVWLLYFTFNSNYKLFLLNTSVCMILGGSTLKAELLHRRLLGLKSRKMCSKAADNMSSNEALHHFTTTSGNFG